MCFPGFSSRFAAAVQVCCLAEAASSVGPPANGRSDKACSALAVFLIDDVGDVGRSGSGGGNVDTAGGKVPVHNLISRRVVCCGRCLSNILAYFCRFLSAYCISVLVLE